MNAGQRAEQARRLAADVQRFGLASATAVVDRYTVLAETALGVDPLAPLRNEPAAAASALTDLSAQMARQYLDLLAAASQVAGQPAEPRIDRVILPETTVGAIAVASLWLHNTTAEPGPGLTVHVGGFIGANGGALPSDAASVAPASVDLAAGMSAEVRVTVAVPSDQPTGQYHGVAVTSASPQTPVMLSLSVVEQGAT